MDPLKVSFGESLLIDVLTCNRTKFLKNSKKRAERVVRLFLMKKDEE